jgi:capsular polysaccharide biosynthesis protein
LDYGRLIVQRGWVLALCALLSAGAMGLVSRAQTPVYRSTYQVLIEPARTEQGVSAGQRSLLGSVVVALHTTETAAEIIAELGMGISPLALKNGTRIGAVPDQMLIRIEVDDTDGEFANIVARRWGDKLIQQRNRLNADLNERDRILAIPQDAPRYALYRPRTAVNMALGGLGGLVLGVLIVFGLEYRQNRRITSRDDVPGLPVLACVPAHTPLSSSQGDPHGRHAHHPQ